MKRFAWLLVLGYLLVGCASDLEAAPPVVVANLDGIAFTAPIPGARITSPVTFKRGSSWVKADCSVWRRANHRGTDYGVAVGTPVRAAAAGTVIRSVDGCPNNGSMSSRCGGGFGNHVMILHDDGYATLYAHMRQGTPIKRGTRVECGQVVGSSGNSGRSSGPHLHWEIRSGVTNETSYFSSGRTVDATGGACGSQAHSLWSSGMCAPATPRDDSRFVRSSLPNETRGTGGLRLTQTFTVRNTGTTTWQRGEVALVHTSGAFSEVSQVDLPSAVEPGGQVELRVDVTVPDAAGLHRGQWRMARLGGEIFGGTGTLSVRVSASPRSCRSSTLGGREVPNGTCVQVNYPGCGERSCEWFACADGVWTCTDGSACPGESIPHDSCEPETPPADGGMPEECRPEGRDCEQDDECCEGLGCFVGACRPVSECRMHGEACSSTTSECCYPLQCRPSSRGGAETCCVSGGNQCSSNADCCGEMACVGGRCEHRREGQSCAHLLDCEGALLCRDGVCRF